jgi:biopolymer transport protein ExbD
MTLENEKKCSPAAERRCAVFRLSPRAILPACALAAALALAFGCASTASSQNRKIHIVINSSGSISIEGTPCRLSAVAKKLKSLGASPQTSIAISVPASGGDAVMRDLTRELASAGFTHFVFMKPREIDASVSSSQRREPQGKRSQ